MQYVYICPPLLSLVLSPPPSLDWSGVWSLVNGHNIPGCCGSLKVTCPPWNGKQDWLQQLISHPTCSLQCDLVTLPSRGGVYVCLLPFFLTIPQDMWDLSSPTGDQTCAHTLEGEDLTIGAPGKFPQDAFNYSSFLLSHNQELCTRGLRVCDMMKPVVVIY